MAAAMVVCKSNMAAQKNKIKSGDLTWDDLTGSNHKVPVIGSLVFPESDALDHSPTESGRAFLVPYLLMLFLCGIPLFFMETVLGQFSSSGCLTVFKICPLFKGAGLAILAVNFICLTYYNVIVSYPLYFLAVSFQHKLPWEDCGNPWNTDMCFKLGTSQEDIQMSRPGQNLTNRIKTPADEFFQNLLDSSVDDKRYTSEMAVAGAVAITIAHTEAISSQPKDYKYITI
ncbi:unnamed protein product [Timema podura]|uniref:Uncharacterized protein n=1 Tax=Timema podura TaxID=61482 RepID=A0ABN7NQ01_TIMPD|nr:unnamed protein product [Timema podura]